MSMMIVAAAIVQQAPRLLALFKKKVKWMNQLVYKAPNDNKETTATYPLIQRHIAIIPMDARLFQQVQVKWI